MKTDFTYNDEEIQKLLSSIGKIIDSQLPSHLGFTLLLFDYGNSGGMFYISKSERQDMIKGLEELIINLKKS